MTMTTATTPQNSVANTNNDDPCDTTSNCDNTAPNNNINRQQPQQQQRSPRPLAEKSVVVWRRPWMIALSLFFLFTIPWTYGVVIRRYWILENWNDALPGLGDSALRKHSMRLHMTFGIIAILCSPIQMIMPFTEGFRRRKAATSITTANSSASASASARNLYRMVHRYVGRVYVMCGMLAFVFGQWFIFLKEFRLVGGYNMGAAFSFAGFFIGYFAYMTWKTAPSNNNNKNNNQNQNQKQQKYYTIEDHRNYAIRSFSQIIAPLLYRYWYTALVLLKIYRTPYLNNSKDLVCDEHNVCPDYQRPFDAIFAWMYWISAWIVAEVVIACLPKHHHNKTTITVDNSIDNVNDTNNTQEEEHATTQTPLLTEQPDDGVSNNSDTDNGNGNGNDTDDDNNSNDESLVSVVNFVGCLLAGATFMVTGLILTAVGTAIMKKGSNDASASVSIKL